MFVETCIAPVNIALIKYWGKRDEDLILPINDSLSMTLSTDEMCAKTTVAASSSFEKNSMWLNGSEMPFEDNVRIMRCLKELQRLALAKGELRFPLEWKLHIVSENNFPTAAGLASSAAGYACAVFALAQLYNIENKDLTSIARLGSGSACRSLHGGFVRWHMGCDSAGSDSIATQVVPENHWPDMHVLVLVVNDARKKTGSTNGMKRSMYTSDLIDYRARHCVPGRISAITNAIKKRDFEIFAKISMQESNQFHAIALDTYPPCVYMNDSSHAIADFVHAYNDSKSSTRVAYTFDAGPNACLFVLRHHVPHLVDALKKSFPNDASNDVGFIKGIPIHEAESDDSDDQPNGLRTKVPVYGKNLFKYMIHTKIGCGPTRIEGASLINEDGRPI